MNIKIKPQASTAMTAAPSEAAAATRPRPATLMAPVDLTPLAPPSAAPVAPPSTVLERSPAAERRQAFFSGQQKILLERLQQPQPDGQRITLPAPQRAACIAVLANIAATVDASE